VLFLFALLFGMERRNLITNVQAIKMYAGEKRAALALK
jgi:hypothetical protein